MSIGRNSGGAAPPGRKTVIIGAGPAGLTAAYELSKSARCSVVLEKESTAGGLARTLAYKGYLFDIGGHRFLTKVGLIEKIWRELLGEEFLTCPRLSRILYRRKFFHYPLEPFNALAGLGIVEAVRCALSYAWARLVPQRPEEHFEAWVTNRFGKRLFKIFFESYTEKVWGLKCTEIGAEWAAQRIRGLSLFSLVSHALGLRGKAIKTLTQEFHYPRLGPGMMWERAQRIIESRGSQVVFEAPVEKIFWESGGVTAVKAGGNLYEGDFYISSMPIRELIEKLQPAPPEWLRSAAADFQYRDFLTVALVVRAKNLFPDNWIYVHDSSVKVGRIQNYKNWSAAMVPDPDNTCLGLEYFCFEGDGLWSMTDAELIELASSEVAALGLVDRSTVVDGKVLRVPKAYPVYDDRYKSGLEAVRRFLKMVPNLQLIGRNGMHRYNNQDHSMLAGVLAARNIMGEQYDLWRVNEDADYLESGSTDLDEDFTSLQITQPHVPEQFSPSRSNARSAAASLKT
jgi:protoporphyrinogen oxidase